MRSLLLLVAIATLTMAAPGKKHTDKGSTPSSGASASCKSTLMPNKKIASMFGYVMGCMQSPNDLKKIISILKEAKIETVDDAKPPTDLIHPLALLQQSQGSHKTIMTLFKCIATKEGFVGNDESFLVEDFKEDIRTMAKGSDVEENIIKGVDNCPTETLTQFQGPVYLTCVLSYCVSGEAPALP